jgi:pyruvate formate lyase activating enzyme
MNEGDIRPLSSFIASIDLSLPVCLLAIAFRPNFILEEHPGATSDLMERCVVIAKNEGLTNVSWSGRVGLPGRIAPVATKIAHRYQSVEAKNLATYALQAGCGTHPRDCKICEMNQKCPIKRHIPRISS